MAVVYRCVGILTVDVIFFRSPGFFHSQDSFPLTFHPWLWETSSGVVAVGVFAAVAHRELWARLPRLHLIYMVHAYCCYVIGQHLDNWNLIGRFLYRCFLWSEVLLRTFLMQDTKFYVFLSLLPSCWNYFYACRFLWLSMQPRIIMLHITYKFGVIKCKLVFGVLHHMLSNSRPFCNS